MVGFLVIVVFAAVTWCVASEGAWGAALVFLCVLFSGLLAMNFFEPLAFFLESAVSNSSFWHNNWDVVSLVGLFALFVWLLRVATEHLSPTFIQMQPMLHEFSRWTCGLLTGYVTTAFLLTALHTAALPREFAGFAPEPERRNPICGLAPDFQWLGFTQYVSARSFCNGGRIFDGPPSPLPGQDNLPHLAGKVWPSFPIRYAARRETPDKAAAASAAAGGSGPRPASSSSGEGTKPNF